MRFVSTENWRRYAAAIGLGLSGGIANCAPLDLGWGNHLLLGNIIALMAFRTCGGVPAAIAVSISSLPTIALWHHPWAWGVWTLEGVFLAILMRRAPLVVLDFIFWLGIGAPLVSFTYNSILGIEGVTLQLIAAKQAFNGILNITCSEFIYSVCVGLPRIRKTLKLQPISIKAVTVSVFLALILLPSAIYLSVTTKSSQSRVTVEILDDLKENLRRASFRFNEWLTRSEITLDAVGREALTTGGGLNEEIFRIFLESKFSEILIVDENLRPLISVGQNKYTVPVPGLFSSDILSDKKSKILNLHTDGLSEPHFDFVVPITANGKNAYIYAVPSISSIQNVLADSLSNIFPRQIGYVAVFDQSQNMVIGINNDNLMPPPEKKLLQEGLDNLSDGRMHIVINGEFGTAAMTQAQNAAAVMRVSLDNPKDWSIVGVNLTKPYVLSARQGQLQLFLTTIIITALVLLSSYWFGSAFEKLLRAIRASTASHGAFSSLSAARQLSFIFEVQDIFNVLERFRESMEHEKQEAQKYIDKLKLLSDYAPLIVYEMDRSDSARTKVQYSGDAGFKLFGYQMADLATPNWWIDHLHADDRVQAASKFLGPDKVDVISGEYRLRTKDGLYRWVFDTQVLAESQVGMGFLLDITELKESQRQLWQASKLAALGEMATGMAHELNQPLNVIKLAAANLCEMARRGTLTEEEWRKRMTRISNQADRAAKLISHLRIFGRAPAERATLFSIAEAVDGALSLIGAQIRNHGISIKIEIAPDIPPVLGHAMLFEQVILNLLVNSKDAIDHHKGMLKEHGRIEISARRNDQTILITIIDNGGGVAPENIGRLFEPFFTTKEVGKGTGLGLPISFGIIRDMGGEIVAKNVEGGAEFSITLPLERH